MEAEYVALSQAVKKALPLRYLLEQLGFPQPGPIIVYEDNMSAINLAIAPIVTKNSKHIAQRHHFIRDMVQQNLAKLVHLPTADMTADLLTKPMSPKLFLRLRDKLMNSSAPSAAPPVTLAGGCQLHDESTSLEPLAMLTAVGIPPIPYRCQHSSCSAVSATLSLPDHSFLSATLSQERSVHPPIGTPVHPIGTCYHPTGTFLTAVGDPKITHNSTKWIDPTRSTSLLKAILNISSRLL
jgi:hypothetical protein